MYAKRVINFKLAIKMEPALLQTTAVGGMTIYPERNFSSTTRHVKVPTASGEGDMAAVEPD